MSTPSQPMTLQELDAALLQLSLRDEPEKATKVASWVKNNASYLMAAGQGHSLKGSDYDILDDPAKWEGFLTRHGLTERDIFQNIVHTAGDDGPTDIMTSTPCAYADPVKPDVECGSSGIQACSGCRLVKYCSKDCQRKHWKIHSKDCKASIRSTQWKPNWIQRGRQPTFLTGDPGLHPSSRGQPLWGTMPAIDVLKLSPDHAQSLRDINIAFIASGDLRNLVMTVNDLRADYTGQLTVLMNDRDRHVTIRNILILQILAQIPNKRHAADMALHLWYSAFMPKKYQTDLVAIGMGVSARTGPFQSKLGDKAVLDAYISEDLRKLCGTSIKSSFKWRTEQGVKELARVRLDPSRVDLRHRAWAPCEPSHRLALDTYNRTGLVLPFGGHAAHFDSPNRFLFSPEGRWLQSDSANPLNGWDIEAVVASGAAHGATREDLYGCLYFHVAAQLHMLAERLRYMRIAIKITHVDALALATDITRGDLAPLGIPANMHFDRIDVSNIVDWNYAGIARVLDAWGGLLKRDEDAAMIAHFMNWSAQEPGAEPGEREARGLVAKLISSGKVTIPDPSRLQSDDEKRKAASEAISAVMHASTAVHDNAPAFERHLAKQGLAAALKKAGLRRRLEHKIVPHRLCAPRNGGPSALPEFKDKESWYLQANVAAPMWTERYIEIVPA